MSEPSSNYTSFILGQLRCVGARVRLMTAEIDSIDVALRGNFINADDAVAWLHEAGATGLITVSSALTLTST
jgi:hypothetical protein